MMETSLQKWNCVFGKDDTKAIKGIVIVLMLFHHLAGFPAGVPVGFPGFASRWGVFITGGFLQSFALSAGICVALYFFLGGYGLFMRQRSSEFSVTGTILDLYKAYWRVFFVFVPIAILFFARSGDEINVLCTRYVFHRKYDIITVVLSNLTGWSNSLNSEWWFLKSYICLIPVGYLFSVAIKRHQNAWVDFFLVLGIDMLLRGIFPSITDWFPRLGEHVFFNSFINVEDTASAFFAGIVFAKYDILCVMKQRIRDILPGKLSKIFALAALYWCRTFVIFYEADIVYCALMIPLMSVLLDECRILKECFGYLGKHSTNMWLIHSFYCYYFLEVTKIVYCTTNVWVDLLILIILSLGSSIALNGFYRTLGRLSGKHV